MAAECVNYSATKAAAAALSDFDEIWYDDAV